MYLVKIAVHTGSCGEGALQFLSYLPRSFNPENSWTRPKHDSLDWPLCAGAKITWAQRRVRHNSQMEQLCPEMTLEDATK